MMTSSVSVIMMHPLAFSSDLLIFEVGVWRLITRELSLGMKPSGILKTLPYMLLKRVAMSRVSSMCCFWSAPTGTLSAP